jgi:class 3 adenylate cyclase/tetratricopeptide (TPR) repeat protein
MRCPQCRHENPGDAKFCLECGRPLALMCAACATELPAGAKFCKECGAPVGTSTATPSRAPAPDSYTPKHLVERIIDSKAALEGERKQVTVLFADLKGSMELLADRDPEEARKLLDPVIEHMMEAVHRFEGTVNQVMGDGIMALFGAPLAHEDHAVRACYAALRMHAAVRRYAEDLRRSQGLDVQIRVGLNSGEVVVRSIGSDPRMDYTAVGQTTHLAARMEQLARPGTTLVTGHTLRLCEGYVQVNPLGPTPVKGLSEPVVVYELTGAGPARTRFQAAAARGLTRFAGRDAEVDQLRHALERAAAGHGQVVAIVGEAGVGKSRLIHEFVHGHLPPTWRVIEAATVSYGRATPYLPIVTLLRDYFEIEEEDDPDKVLDKVSSRLRGPDDGLVAGIPVVLSLLDAPVRDEAWEALDPTQQRRRVLDFLRRLLLRESQIQPVCLVVEDMHWIDSETQSLLDRLIESLPTARILCLVSSRPQFEPGWGTKSYYAEISLDPLAPELAQSLVDALLGAAPGLGPLKAQMIERTEGNPFFLEESVWHLVETGALVGQRGAYHLTRPVREAQVPVTVHAVLAARIDRLPMQERRLLQAAAVIGKDIPHPLLAAISDLAEDQLRQSIRSLQSAELLYEVTLFPAPRYTFKHALTLEVAAASLLRERRRALDARIVEALEALVPERAADQTDRLAHHAVRAELWEKALTYCRNAGTRAFARSAHRAAVEWFEQALVALQHLPETPDTVATSVDLRLDLRYSLSPLGEFAKMGDHLQKAEHLATASGDRRRLGLVTAFLTNFHTVMLNCELASEYGWRAIGIGSETGDTSVQVLANTFLGLARFALGDYRQAVELARRNVALLEGDLVRERFGMALLPAVYSRTVLLWCLAERGEFVEGIPVGDEAIRIAEAAEHPFSIVFARVGLGTLFLRRGDLPDAVAQLEAGLALCHSAEIRGGFLDIAAALSSSYVLSGRAGDALHLQQEAVDHAVAMGDPFGHWFRTGGLAEIYLASGRAEEALPLARRGLQLAQLVRSRGVEGWALRLVGEAEGSQTPPLADEAEATYHQAIVRAEELEMRPLEARCHFGLGKLYLLMGKREQAREHLTTATTMYREMDMRFWLEQAEAEMRELA